MVSTRRTQSRIEDNVSAGINLATKENIFSPRKTRSGRSRVNQRSVSTPACVSSDDNPGNIKTSTTKRRGRPSKQCIKKSSKQNRSEKSETEADTTPVSPMRRPLVEVRSVDQQLGPKARSPNKLGDNVCTPKSRNGDKRLAVYSSPVVCKHQMNKFSGLGNGAAVKIGMSGDTLPMSNIVDNDNQESVVELEPDIEIKTNDGLFNDTHDCSSVSSEVDDREEMCNTNSPHLSGTPHRQYVTTMDSIVIDNVEPVLMPEGMHSPGHFHDPEKNLVMDMDNKEFISTLSNVNDTDEHLPVDIHLVQTPQQVNGTSTHAPPTRTSSHLNESSLAIPSSVPEQRSPVTKQDPCTILLSPPNEHVQVMETTSQDLQERLTDANTSRSLSHGPASPLQALTHQCLLTGSNCCEHPLRLPATPTTTWINGIEYPLPPDTWSPSPMSCARHETPGMSQHFASVSSPQRSGPPMLEAEFQQCSENLIVKFEHKQRSEAGGDRPLVTEEAEQASEVIACTNPWRHEESTLSLRQNTSPIHVAHDEIFTIANETSAETSNNAPSDAATWLHIATLEDPLSISNLMYETSPILDTESTSQDCDLKESSGTIVPELTDDSLVEAFEHDLGIPETALMSPPTPSVSQNCEFLSNAAEIVADHVELKPQCLKHVDEVERLEASFSVTDSVRDLSFPNLGDGSIQSSPLNDGLSRSAEVTRDFPSPVVTTAKQNETYSLLSKTCDGSTSQSQNDRLSDSSLGNAEELSFIHVDTITDEPRNIDVTFSPVKNDGHVMPHLQDIRASPENNQDPTSPIVSFDSHIAPSINSARDSVPDTGEVDQAFNSTGSQRIAKSETHELEHVNHHTSSPTIKKTRKSAARRQSRRQSYMTATKSAVRERELELQRRQENQEQADLQLSTELEPAESLLEEMPGSVERKRSKRRSNSTSRRSPLFDRLHEISISHKRMSTEASSSPPVVLKQPSDQLLHERSAIAIQACFRGWRERQRLKDADAELSATLSPTDADAELPTQESDTNALADVRIEERNFRRSGGIDSSIDNVFSDFLKQWQSKKSQKAKLDDITPSAELSFLPGTPRRSQAGTVSPQKSDKKVVSIVNALPSSAQKSSKTSSQRASRSRLPAPRSTIQAPIPDTNQGHGTRQVEAKRSISCSNMIEHDATLHEASSGDLKADIDRKRKDNDTEMIDGPRKRTRLTKSAIPGPASSNLSSNLSMSRNKPPAIAQLTTVMPPTTPKRLLYLTPAEVAKTTRNFTSLNRLYRCDFDRVVVRKEIQRPPSPNAKLQAKLATNARTKRRRLMKEKGYTFGAGDDEDYVPKAVTPERKAVKFAEALEVNLASLPKTTPSKVRNIEQVTSCIAPVSLDDYGNTAGNAPLTPELGKAPTVLITKYLYRGEQDDT